MNSSPREALFTPLGVSLHRSETWLHIRIRGEERVFRPTQAWGLGFLMELNPDAEHWRRMFPTVLQGRKIDVQMACSAVHKLCLQAGEIVQQSGGSGEGGGERRPAVPGTYTR